MRRLFVLPYLMLGTFGAAGQIPQTQAPVHETKPIDSARSTTEALVSEAQIEDYLTRLDADWLLKLDRQTIQNRLTAAQPFLESVSERVYASPNHASVLFRKSTDAKGLPVLVREDYDTPATVRFPYRSPGYTLPLEHQEVGTVERSDRKQSQEKILTIVASGKDYLLVQEFPQDEKKLPLQSFTLIRSQPAENGRPPHLIVKTLILDPDEKKVKSQPPEILEQSDFAKTKLLRNTTYLGRRPGDSAPALVTSQATGKTHTKITLEPADEFQSAAMRHLSNDLDWSTSQAIPTFENKLGAARGIRRISEPSIRFLETEGIRAAQVTEAAKQKRDKLVSEIEITQAGITKELGQIKEDSSLESDKKWLFDRLWHEFGLFRKLSQLKEFRTILNDKKEFDRWMALSPLKVDTEVYQKTKRLLKILEDGPDAWKEDGRLLLNALDSNKAGIAPLLFLANKLFAEAKDFAAQEKKATDKKIVDLREILAKDLAKLESVDEQTKRMWGAATVKYEADRKTVSEVDSGIGYYFTRQSTLDAARKKAENARDASKSVMNKLALDIQKNASSIKERKEKTARAEAALLENEAWQNSPMGLRLKALTAINPQISDIARLWTLLESKKQEIVESDAEQIRAKAHLEELRERLPRQQRQLGPLQTDLETKQSNAANLAAMTIIPKGLVEFAGRLEKSSADAIAKALKESAGKLKSVTLGGRNWQPVLREVPQTSLSEARQLADLPGDRAGKFYWLDLHGLTHKGSERILVAVTADQEKKPMVKLVALNGRLTSAELENLKLVAAPKGANTAGPETLTGHVNQTADFYRRFQDGRNLTELPDYPSIKASLERQGLVPRNFRLEDVKIKYFPGSNSDFEGAASTSAFIFPVPGQYLKEFTFPNPRAQRLLNQELGDLVIYSRFPIHSLKGPYSDVPFHEVVHLVRRFGGGDQIPGPTSNESPTSIDFHNAVLSMINDERKSPDYQKKWASYRIANQQRKLDPLLKPELTEGILRQEFETRTYGEDFKMIKPLWKEQFDYFHRPEEVIAWKASLSYQKHERKMSFEDAVIAMNRSAGGTSESGTSQWLLTLLRTWWDAV